MQSSLVQWACCGSALNWRGRSPWLQDMLGGSGDDVQVSTASRSNWSKDLIACLNIWAVTFAESTHYIRHFIHYGKENSYKMFLHQLLLSKTWIIWRGQFPTLLHTLWLDQTTWEFALIEYTHLTKRSKQVDTLACSLRHLQAFSEALTDTWTLLCKMWMRYTVSECESRDLSKCQSWLTSLLSQLTLNSVSYLCFWVTFAFCSGFELSNA